jgi:predicted ABC-type ATPase
MIAGPNGAGKTTLTRRLRRQGVELGYYINPDEIAETLTGSYEARVIEAQGIADHRREACLAEKQSFTFETVMSHPSKVDFLARARDAGFATQMFFVGTAGPTINLQRVASRVAQGGHDVPADRIIARWKRTMDLLYGAIEASNRTSIFDNSTSTGPRFVMDILNLRATDRKVAYCTGPIPEWVRHYVVDRYRLSGAPLSLESYPAK